MRVPVPVIFVTVLLFGSGFLPLQPVQASDESELADLLIKMVQAGRKVMAEHQQAINDPSKGDKGFTPEVFEKEITHRYLEMTKIDLSQPPTTQRDKLLQALLETGKEVVSDHQPAINKTGISYKNFIPAVWARKTGDKFERKTGIRLKLTSSNYRYQGNKPDEFEAEVLKLFEGPEYPKGKSYSRTTMRDGKPVLRVLVPEYASTACLQCHGEPRGQRDISGSRKEGWQEGSLAGAISLITVVK